MGTRKSSIKIGEIYGRWTVLFHAGKQEKSPKRTLFYCRCTCGVERKVDAGNLKKPGNKSCGCLRRELARVKGKKQRTIYGYMNLYYFDTHRSANDRKIHFGLTKEIFYNLIQQPCYYCNDPGSKTRRRKDVGIPIAVNGIDRINSDLGYIESNCRPCCTSCNFMKNTLNEGAFYTHLVKIVKHKGLV